MGETGAAGWVVIPVLIAVLIGRVAAAAVAAILIAGVVANAAIVGAGGWAAAVGSIPLTSNGEYLYKELKDRDRN